MNNKKNKISIQLKKQNILIGGEFIRTEESKVRFIKLCKGKDKKNIKSLEGSYWTSIKYDGNYIQIHKFGNNIRFFTSGV